MMKGPAMTEQPAPAAATDMAIVNLDFPVKRGETEIATIYIKKPKGPVLYDFFLPDIPNLKGSALFQLLPLITDPPLVRHEVENLDPSDLQEIGGVIRGFFMTKAERAFYEKILTGIQPEN
jgi:hypothetical protein